MTEMLSGLGLMFVLLGAAAGGMRLQGLLKEHHRTQVTTDAIRTVAGMVVTFAALVLGLLVTSTKADFDDHALAYRTYGICLIQLDLRLREYGPSVAAIRQELRTFTATAIAVTWPNEGRPAGAVAGDLKSVAPGSDETEALTRLLVEMDDAIEQLAPTDIYHQKLAAILQEDIRRVEAVRWSLVERSASRIDPIFLGVMLLWLAVVFLIFGVTTPRNALTWFVTAISALAVASSLYLVIDLDDSLGGFIAVPSAPLRAALWHMDSATGL